MMTQILTRLGPQGQHVLHIIKGGTTMRNCTRLFVLLSPLDCDNFCCYV